MQTFIIFLVACFIIYNFAEYKALRWGWNHGGLIGVFKMMVAIMVRLFFGIFIKE